MVPRPFRSLAIVLAMLAAVLFVTFGVDSLAYPWAFTWMRPITGMPALVGKWFGELTTPTGRRQWIVLDLDAHLGRCISTCSRVQAIARVCDARGLREYEGRGRAHDWRGTRFDLELLATDDRQEGLRVIELQARRDGDAVRAIARFASGSRPATIAVDERGRIARPAVDPDTLFPTNVLLRRGSERAFERACRRSSSPP
jgi:hypothetical protein